MGLIRQLDIRRITNGRLTDISTQIKVQREACDRRNPKMAKRLGRGTAREMVLLDFGRRSTAKLIS